MINVRFESNALGLNVHIKETTIKYYSFYKTFLFPDCPSIFLFLNHIITFQYLHKMLLQAIKRKFLDVCEHVNPFI